MDMLGNPSFRCILTEYYHKSNEPKFVRCAINTARLQKHEQTNASNESITSEVGLSIFGERKVFLVNTFASSSFVFLLAQYEMYCCVGKCILKSTCYHGSSALIKAHVSTISISLAVRRMVFIISKRVKRVRCHKFELMRYIHIYLCTDICVP